MDCSICISQVVSPVSCYTCRFTTCKECIMTYIIESKKIECMVCRTIFNEPFLYSNFSQAYVNIKLGKIIADTDSKLIIETTHIYKSLTYFEEMREYFAEQYLDLINNDDCFEYGNKILDDIRTCDTQVIKYNYQIVQLELLYSKK